MADVNGTAVKKVTEGNDVLKAAAKRYLETISGAFDNYNELDRLIYPGQSRIGKENTLFNLYKHEKNGNKYYQDIAVATSDFEHAVNEYLDRDIRLTFIDENNNEIYVFSNAREVREAIYGNINAGGRFSSFHSIIEKNLQENRDFKKYTPNEFLKSIGRKEVREKFLSRLFEVEKKTYKNGDEEIEVNKSAITYRKGDIERTTNLNVGRQKESMFRAYISGKIYSNFSFYKSLFGEEVTATSKISALENTPALVEGDASFTSKDGEKEKTIQYSIKSQNAGLPGINQYMALAVSILQREDKTTEDAVQSMINNISKGIKKEKILEYVESNFFGVNKK